MEAQESALDGIVRETWEEVGVAVAADDLAHVHTFRTNDARSVALYATLRWSGIPRAVEAGTAVRWVRVRELARVGPALPSLAASEAPLLGLIIGCDQ